MLFLFEFLLVLFFIVFLTLTIKFRVEIKELEFSSKKKCSINTLGKSEKTHLNKKYQVRLVIYLLNTIPIFKLTINKKRIDKLKDNTKNKIKNRFKEKIKKQNQKRLENNYNIKSDVKTISKNIVVKVKKFELDFEIGTENVILTSFLVPFISYIISYMISKNQENIYENKYNIKPIFKENNIINFKLNCIFEIKLIHIITAICIIKKKRRVDKNERTPNRKHYDYSYE